MSAEGAGVGVKAAVEGLNEALPGLNAGAETEGGFQAAAPAVMPVAGLKSVDVTLNSLKNGHYTIKRNFGDDLKIDREISTKDNGKSLLTIVGW